ncbi:hypothetical protein N3Z17_05255 [Candidatus Bandiella numerosa]|jgi:hypothetical protein|nr:hypothetical protein [Candidatus Bandiella numerosa]WHA04630.1 hypothetical protein N3Z17_05255 [Candidatus Bandiella numerosa]
MSNFFHVEITDLGTCSLCCSDFNSLNAAYLGLYEINSVMLAYCAIIKASTASVLVLISLLFAKDFMHTGFNYMHLISTFI